MINYEMALSEIEMYKKAHESLSENLTHANKKAQQFKAERDTQIEDIAVLKANIGRLEQENHDFKKRNALLMNTVDDLDKENKALRLQSDTYFDEWQNEKLTSQGLREQCKEYAQNASKYTTLINHIRDMKFASPYSYNYIHLVNFIKELEREDDDH